MTGLNLSNHNFIPVRCTCNLFNNHSLSGIPDYFVEHGTQDELYRECGYDAEGIEMTIREVIVKFEWEKQGSR